jgi:para-aminobenzoate synthetase/4-amino-4-deoxychorismate lyase
VPRSEQLEGGVFETVLVLDGVPVRLAEHLARLDRSARELYRRGVPPDLSARAAELAAAATADRSALRITCTPDGLGLDLAPAPAPPGSSAVRTGSRGASVWRHKWAERAELAAAERAAGPAAPLFVAPDGTVLETSRGNVFVLRADGSLMTAPLRDDLLPGVTRRALLDLARDAGWAVELCEFGVEEMVRGVPFWTSSLSGAVPIHAVDGRPTRRDDRAVARLARALTGGDATIR